MVVETRHPALGTLRTLGSPIKMSQTPPEVTRRAPQLGEHTSEVLGEAGYDEEAIAALRSDGATR
jgi:crotonobetainyl-CoA:carnitine CoA-transferase CaiB-like acyl-CoA transferase